MIRTHPQGEGSVPEIERILQNNRRWVEERLAEDADYFKTLAQDQNPDYLYIGCSDSRVPANTVMGLAPGDVFVHRNVGNLVPNTDLDVMSTIDYAVRQLRVKHIIVCGHYRCGGVQAAMQSRHLGLLDPWLRNIRDVYRLHRSELDAIEDVDARYDRLVELNVQESCLGVIKTAAVQLAYLETGYPSVHGLVFDMRTGLLKDLHLDFPALLRDIQRIYDLTGQ